VDGAEYALDLPLSHIKQMRYVVVAARERVTVE
jgi:hypothetical protein